MKEEAINVTPIGQQWGLGPDLRSLGWLEHLEVSKYFLKHHGIKIIVMIVAMVGLVVILHAWNELYPR